MAKAILSKVNLDIDMYDNFLAIEFNSCVGDLLYLDDVQKLACYKQHFSTTRLQHSINVAYYSYLTCRVLRFDYRSAARAGLLHDLFLYDRKLDKHTISRHAAGHPVVALNNAKKNISLNKIEADAILKHMWPVTPIPPRYKESLVVSTMDKCCCLCEIGDQFIRTLNKAYSICRSIFSGFALAK